MPLLYVSATGIGALDTWIANTGTKVDAVFADDGATTVISRANTTGNQDFTFGPISLGVITGITSVAVEAVARWLVGAVSFRNRLRVNGTVYQGTLTAASSSFATYKETWFTNPATGSLWLQADVEGTGSNPLQQYGIGNLSGITTGESIECTLLRMEIDYTTAAGPRLLTLLGVGT